MTSCDLAAWYSSILELGGGRGEGEEGGQEVIAISEEKSCKGSIRCKEDTIEKHSSITCHLKPNVLLGNQSGTLP